MPASAARAARLPAGTRSAPQSGESAHAEVLDAGLVGVAQRIEHYQIAAYGCARTYARLLGDDWAAQLLQMSLDEESNADRQLSSLADRVINVRAR